ncbi:MAG TPA: MOSC N-terminal beta barrel domain-containing protein [Terriglobia bacterium]|nr:MOSC N-terminal beta barrel domain-containing protein [Terriglobia bacterium]
MASSQKIVGSTLSLWRYPVKSVMGEELYAAEVTARGLAGDRAYALVDGSDGKVVSAKNPRKWPDMFYLRAALDAVPEAGAKVPPVRITLPDGKLITSDQPDIHQILSRVLNREVKLTAAAVPSATCEAYWPDIEGLDRRNSVTEFGLPEGTFFDCGIVHILTTATLNKLRMLYPGGRYEVRRFRPNIVLDATNGEEGFVENAWIGKELAIGESVRLSITRPCIRCVMTTLPQGDLPKDPGILRSLVQHNQSGLGVYAAVLQGGRICRGDSVRLV